MTETIQTFTILPDILGEKIVANYIAYHGYDADREGTTFVLRYAEGNENDDYAMAEMRAFLIKEGIKFTDTGTPVPLDPPAPTLPELIAQGRAALASLEESRADYAAAYEAWEDNVMDTHIGEVSDSLSALINALDPKGATQ